MRSESKERSWLSWLSKVRIIVITFLLAIELAIMRLTVTSVPERAFLTLIGLWYAIAVFYVLVLSVWREHRTQSQLQVITDLLFANAIIYLTGGIDTTFNFLNPLIIIVACILLPRAWAYLTALLSFILFGGILELSFFDLIHSYSSSRPDPNSLQLVIFINLFAYVAVAYLASKMVARLHEANHSGNPILLRTSTSSGHGIGTALSERIKQSADIYAFLLAQFYVETSPKSQR